MDVLARLDPDSLDLSNPGVHRTDRDFPIAWIKPYGRGRVFYSYIGHPDAAWDDPARADDCTARRSAWAMGRRHHPPAASADGALKNSGARYSAPKLAMR